MTFSSILAFLCICASSELSASGIGCTAWHFTRLPIFLFSLVRQEPVSSSSAFWFVRNQHRKLSCILVRQEPASQCHQVCVLVHQEPTSLPSLHSGSSGTSVTVLSGLHSGSSGASIAVQSPLHSGSSGSSVAVSFAWFVSSPTSPLFSHRLRGLVFSWFHRLAIVLVVTSYDVVLSPSFMAYAGAIPSCIHLFFYGSVCDFLILVQQWLWKSQRLYHQ